MGITGLLLLYLLLSLLMLVLGLAKRLVKLAIFGAILAALGFTALGGLTYLISFM